MEFVWNSVSVCSAALNFEVISGSCVVHSKALGSAVKSSVERVVGGIPAVVTCRCRLKSLGHSSVALADLSFTSSNWIHASNKSVSSDLIVCSLVPVAGFLGDTFLSVILFGTHVTFLVVLAGLVDFVLWSANSLSHWIVAHLEAPATVHPVSCYVVARSVDECHHLLQIPVLTLHCWSHSFNIRGDHWMVEH